MQNRHAINIIKNADSKKLWKSVQDKLNTNHKEHEINDIVTHSSLFNNDISN